MSPFAAFALRPGAVTALLLGSAALATSELPASAADLGGDCCADLEERIGELEATAARKGTRKTSLEIFGQINTAVLIWDDGVNRDAYVVDNDFNSIRLGFRGTSKLSPGWKAGYLLEFETNHAASDAVNQNDASGPVSRQLDLRYSHFTIESETLGKLTMGQTSSVTDNLYKYGNISGSFSDSELHYNGQFFLRRSGAGGTSTTLRWDTIANNLDTSRGNFVRYDTPSLAGFIASAAWGEDDMWDVSLRYSGEACGFKIAAAVGYVEDMDGAVDRFDDEPNDLIASIGIQHLESGLYVYSGAGRRESDVRPGFDDTAQYYYVQAGIETKLISLGKTTIFADYGHYSDWGAGTAFDSDVATPDAAAANDATVLDSKVERWGFGATQKVDNAALEIYGVFNWYEADVIAAGVAGGLGPAFALPVEDWWSTTLGSRIKF